MRVHGNISGRGDFAVLGSRAEVNQESRGLQFPTGAATVIIDQTCARNSHPISGQHALHTQRATWASSSSKREGLPTTLRQVIAFTIASILVMAFLANGIVRQ